MSNGRAKVKKKRQTEHMQLNRPELRNPLNEFQTMVVNAIEDTDADLLQSYFEGEKQFSETFDFNFPITKELTTPLMLAASLGE
jgi:hypothetical protein